MVVVVKRELVIPLVVLFSCKALKTMELLTYKGRNIKEAQDSFYQAELKWHEDSRITWSIDIIKVTHCASCFEGIARDIRKYREQI
jgi:hypothetical protein